MHRRNRHPCTTARGQTVCSERLLILPPAPGRNFATPTQKKSASGCRCPTIRKRLRSGRKTVADCYADLHTVYSHTHRWSVQCRRCATPAPGDTPNLIVGGGDLEHRGGESRT